VRRHDFLHDPLPVEARGAAIVTNPPFCRLDAFIARSLGLLDGGAVSAVVLLVRVDALTAGGRAVALNRAAQIWQCNWRPVWIANSTGTGRWSNAWVCWRADRGGFPCTQFLPSLGRSGDLFNGEIR
jgi:hypothetical protein